MMTRKRSTLLVSKTPTTITSTIKGGITTNDNQVGPMDTTKTTRRDATLNKKVTTKEAMQARVVPTTINNAARTLPKTRVPIIIVKMPMPTSILMPTLLVLTRMVPPPF